MILGFLVGGRQIRIGRRRIHHGPVGVGLALLGVALLIDDIHDWPWRTR